MWKKSRKQCLEKKKGNTNKNIENPQISQKLERWKVQKLTWKIYWGDSKVVLNRQKRDSANFDIAQLKLRKEIGEKWIELKGPLEHYQVDQLTHCISPRRKKEKMKETLFEEIMAENLQNLKNSKKINIQETQWILNGINPKRSTPRHIIIKLVKSKTTRVSQKLEEGSNWSHIRNLQ